MSENFRLDKQLCFNLYNAHRQVNRYYSNKVFKKYNITYPQYLVLSILWDESPVNVKKLVTELSLDTGTISPLLKRMEANNLIVRTRSELDQREVFISLTDKSIAMKDDLYQVTEIINEVSQFTEEERKCYSTLLNKLINNLSND
ncbi:MarR family winged helix-turn-helix transcriptional regulator [Macrococcoides caseolyticum]|uniref:MarR family transcriptional regulator n=1 Tax=Macrococcus psychrotolerans TaxID=3039389 RepID=A0AAU6RFL6_9STAP|nr:MULTISPECIES: MarR family transcriptional regulator [Macrococcus]MBQ5153228.1 MarR family transcriptional regulator [Macrococcus caseolyticus]MDJ1111173.1 MarR family transcriptional regulator [Macrococcus sp. S115]QYA33308.1 MarR family transcriptional regulator [Macrococcus sp. 19Msa1099]QYA38123.1 MarR family transcriptional regulator [Macrococcus caseolyticus]QYA76830.1 MarR family transcriptional regulator [Macrococcus caseolyticus]